MVEFTSLKDIKKNYYLYKKKLIVSIILFEKVDSKSVNIKHW